MSPRVKKCQKCDHVKIPQTTIFTVKKTIKHGFHEMCKFTKTIVSLMFYTTNMKTRFMTVLALLIRCVKMKFNIHKILWQLWIWFSYEVTCQNNQKNLFDRILLQCLCKKDKLYFVDLLLVWFLNTKHNAANVTFCNWFIFCFNKSSDWIDYIFLSANIL